MRDFADLLENLVFSPGRNAKLAHLQNWLLKTDSASRGYGVAAMTGDLELPYVKGKMIRDLAQSTTDEVLFRLSYDFVGDLAETVSLLWPQSGVETPEDIHLHDVVETLQASSRSEAEAYMRHLLDNLTQTQRWALLKMATGGLRVGVSARLMRVALANAFETPVEEIEEIWPLLSPPYEALFAWLEGKAEKPNAEGRAVFKPLMLAHPLEDKDQEKISLSDYQMEWKWDGARVQLVCAKDGVRLFSRSGDDISASFPELVSPLPIEGVLDGELLAGTPSQLGSFNDLQQRLNRKKASQKLQETQPVFIRCYDILQQNDSDLRHLPLRERRLILESHLALLSSEKLDISALVDAADWSELDDLRLSCRDEGLIEGIMLKRKDSPYQIGRVTGQWYKWKRNPLFADVVIMYAQRGHGRRSSQYSDFTFGAWQETGEGRQLVPVGKAYSGFTDAELKELDKFVRQHTTSRFGPVREVEQKLVIEAAFDSIHLSKRHKSGVAMRFPRFHTIRWDKDPEEADTLETLQNLVS